MLSEPLPVLHDFYTCTWVSTNQRCLLPFTRECCESEAAFVFSRMLGKFVKQFEYSWIFLLPLPSTLSLRFLRPLLITTREICSTMAETTQRVLNFSPGPAKLPEEVSQCIAYNFSVWSISSISLPNLAFFLRPQCLLPLFLCFLLRFQLMSGSELTYKVR